MEQEQKPEQQEEKEIKVTFETLFDLLRNEKSRESIQKLESSFYTDVKNYILEKTSLMESQSKTSDLFSATERSKTEKQLTNARKIIKEIYERREKKVISMAVNKSRISSNLIDTTPLLKEEKEFFEQVVSLLSGWITSVLLSIMEGKTSLLPPKGLEQKEKPEKQSSEETSDPSKKSVRFSKTVPAFIGQDLKEYGPFEDEDTTELPIEIANLLIDKGNAEEI